MDGKGSKKNIRLLAMVLGVLWFIFVILLGLGIISKTISINLTSILIDLLPLALLWFAIEGLWKYKKRGLTLTYIYGLIVVIKGIFSNNKIGIITWIIITYYLYTKRDVFS